MKFIDRGRAFRALWIRLHPERYSSEEVAEASGLLRVGLGDEEKYVDPNILLSKEDRKLLKEEEERVRKNV